jgi:hypothetical protein
MATKQKQSPNTCTMPLTPVMLAAVNGKAAEICASGATVTISSEVLLDALESRRAAIVADYERKLNEFDASIPQEQIDDEVEAILRKSSGTGGEES